MSVDPSDELFVFKHPVVRIQPDIPALRSSLRPLMDVPPAMLEPILSSTLRHILTSSPVSIHET